MERRIIPGERPRPPVAYPHRSRISSVPRHYPRVQSNTPTHSSDHKPEGVLSSAPQNVPSIAVDVPTQHNTLSRSSVPSLAMKRQQGLSGTFIDIVPPKKYVRPSKPATYSPEPAAVMTQTVDSSKDIAHSAKSRDDHISLVNHKGSHKRRQIRITKSNLFQAMAVFLFVFGMYVAVDGWFMNRAVQTQATVLATRSNVQDGAPGQEVLSEDEENTSNSNYQVPADMPRMLEIPKLVVSAKIIPVGVDAANTLAAPSNINDTGWYKASSKPDDATGAMLIDGHVSGPTKKGVFYSLKTLKAGDEILIQKGNLDKSTFVVKHVETVKVNQVDMVKMMRSIDESKLGLNLITCGGRFDPSTNQYESRTLVFAVKR